MATYYVKSTATGTADGLSWANAFLTLAAADAVDVVGDTIFVSHQHNETTNATVTFSWAGTDGNPTKIICVNDASEPPTTLATTAQIASSFGGNITTLNPSYYFGINFVSNNVYTIRSAKFNQCRLTLNVAGKTVAIGNSSSHNPDTTEFNNCTFSFLASSGIVVYGGAVSFSGGGMVAGSLSDRFIHQWGQNGRGGGDISITGFDFSGAPSNMNVLLSTAIYSGGTITLTNCKMPSGWTGGLFSTSLPTVTAPKIVMTNCDSVDTNCRLWTSAYAGMVYSETAIVRTGGASDGTTPLAWKMISSTTPNFRGSTLATPEIVVWNDSIGTAKTVTVEVLTDGVTLKDDECWLEVQYLGTSGFPLGVFASDAKADVLATAADQATSTEAWTTTGLTTPVKQKLSVTFTAQEKGFVHAKVMLAKPSTTVYVCPKASVT